MTTAIAVTNKKGGVGKTTVAAHLAAALHHRGADVLAVDGDPQGSLSAHFTVSKAGLRNLVDRGVVDVRKPDPDATTGRGGTRTTGGTGGGTTGGDGGGGDRPTPASLRFPVPDRGGDTAYEIDLTVRFPSVKEALYDRRGVDNLGFRLVAGDDLEFSARRRGIDVDPDAPLHRTLAVDTTDGPDVVGAHRDMEGVGDRLATETDAKERLGRVLEALEPAYDYVVIDTPANVDVIKDSAVIYATNLVVPTHPESAAVDATRQHLRDTVEQIEGTAFADEGEIDVVAVVPSDVRPDGEADTVLSVLRREVPDRYYNIVEKTPPEDFDPSDLPAEFWRGRTTALDGVPEALDEFWSVVGSRPLITDERDYTPAVTDFEVRKRAAIKRAARWSRTLFTHDESCDQRATFERLAALVAERTGGATAPAAADGGDRDGARADGGATRREGGDR